MLTQPYFGAYDLVESGAVDPEAIHNAAISQIHGEFVTARPTAAIVTAAVAAAAADVRKSGDVAGEDRSGCGEGGASAHRPSPAVHPDLVAAGAVLLVGGAGLVAVNGYYRAITHVMGVAVDKAAKVQYERICGPLTAVGGDGSGEAPLQMDTAGPGQDPVKVEIVYDDEEYDGWYFLLMGSHLTYSVEATTATPPLSGWQPVEIGTLPTPTLTFL
jgi:hypothetical protein